MTELLKNHVGGEWVAGGGEGTTLRDPVTGEALVRVSSEGLDLDGAFAFARAEGGDALRGLSYGARAALLAAIGKVLHEKRDAYYAIATANSGTTKADSGIDIEGALYTLGWYAKAGAALGDARALRDGASAPLSKEGGFASQHVLTPTRGVALLVNAFNFPAWGLWEKAAPALLSGVPVIVKPATQTAWLAHRMVADVVASGVLPKGALSIVCGAADGLLDRVGAFDVVSFTGSARTASILRAHAAFVQRSARINVEADSLNAAALGPGASADAEAAFVSEVVREMTVKSGQKCTAIRRAFVPLERFDAVGEALAAKLAKVTVGNPRNEAVRMGSLVSREQRAAVLAGLDTLRREARVLFDGSAAPLVDADPAVSACVAPYLLGMRDGDGAAVHDVEVFGPVATVLAYRDEADLVAKIRRGGGSLVTSLFADEEAWITRTALDLASTHGRVHAVTPAVAKAQTGHGNVMPQSLHGGPGRAGGGEELGGLRALGFYHRRTAFQGPATAIEALGPSLAG